MTLDTIQVAYYYTINPIMILCIFITSLTHILKTKNDGLLFVIINLIIRRLQRIIDNLYIIIQSESDIMSIHFNHYNE